MPLFDAQTNRKWHNQLQLQFVIILGAILVDNLLLEGTTDNLLLEDGCFLKLESG